MRKVHNNREYLFYYILSFVLAITIVSLWPALGMGLLRITYLAWFAMAGLIFLPISKKYLGDKHRQQKAWVFKIWAIEIAIVLVIFITDTIEKFLWPLPMANHIWLNWQISDMLSIFAAFSSFIVILSFVVYFFDNPLSILPFMGPKAVAEQRLSVYGNTWLRQTTITCCALYLCLSWLCIQKILSKYLLLSPDSSLANAVAFGATMIIVISPFCTRIFKKWNRQGKSFAWSILAVFTLMIFMEIACQWLLAPFGSNSLAIVFPVPQGVLRFSLAIMATALAIFFCVPCCQGRTVRAVSVTLLVNPIIWLLVVVECFYHLVSKGQMWLLAQPALLLSLSIMLIASTLMYMGSRYCAKIFASLFTNDGYKHQGPMPWYFACNYLPAMVALMAALTLTGMHLLQYIFATLGGCMLIVYGVSFYLFVGRVRREL